jgi:DNA mismatch repair protein MutS2
MERQSLAVLEFPLIVERLAEATVTPQGAALARALGPSAAAAEVATRQARTTEAVGLLETGTAPSLHAVADVRVQADRAERGGSLNAAELRAVADTIAGALTARATVAGQRETSPLLAALLDAVDPTLASVSGQIDRCVEEDGAALRDTASPLLRRLRNELRAGRQRVAEELARLARSPELRDHLQETFVTDRGGRPVLAVKASARSQVRGIVHDASSSGQTLFVEPLAVVEVGNRLAEVAGAEREEVERVLAELSARVGAVAGALTVAVDATGAVDLAIACGTLSRRWRGTAVEVAEGVRLLGVRHPLLPDETAVPIDLDLGELRALVVSGPNTGGKTVALKTLGLAALLHQSGLRPPADRAVLPVFDAVLADIGDQQSIQMSLSTFSGHLGNIVRILEAAGDRSLVLLDELAAGTDPAEGAALAQALLARLAAQARLTVVTTHYAELKEWASATDGAANAATAYDVETDTPLYRVALGRPGTSHALRVAERLGLDPDVVADARERVVPALLRAAELLAEAERAERAAGEARAASERARADAERLAAHAEERRVALEAEIERVRASADAERASARAGAEEELRAARAALEALREEIRRARRQERTRRQAQSAAVRAAERRRDRRLGAAVDEVDRVEQILRELDEPLPVLAPLEPGDPVEARELGVQGTIAAIEGEEAEVLVSGGLRVRLPLAALRPHATAAAAGLGDDASVKVIASARGDASDQLDVRGLRADEARDALRAFVDDAALAGLHELTIVHGRGTGALRAAVRSELDAHPLVERHETGSAGGATVAVLA